MTASGNRPPHPIGPPPGGYRSVNIPVVRREDFSDRTYLLELEQGRSKPDAAVVACTEVGRACLYTSLTTFAERLTLSISGSSSGISAERGLRTHTTSGRRSSRSLS